MLNGSVRTHCAVKYGMKNQCICKKKKKNATTTVKECATLYLFCWIEEVMLPILKHVNTCVMTSIA